MKVAVRFGHQATGVDGASVGIIREFDVNREYGPYVISGLQRLGDSAINVTPPEANRSLGDSLVYGINLANNNGVDLFVSCHANDYDGNARGCEVVYTSEAGKAIAERICNEIHALGFPYHKGAYQDERGLAELRETNMPAVIIEPFFVSSQEDVNLYHEVGPERLGYAIVKGIKGQDVPAGSTTVAKPVYKSKDKIVCYNCIRDWCAAEYLADYLQCSAIDNSRPYDYSGYKEVYCVGGGEFTNYATKIIKGADSPGTMIEVLKFMGRI